MRRLTFLLALLAPAFVSVGPLAAAATTTRPTPTAPPPAPTSAPTHAPTVLATPSPNRVATPSPVPTAVSLVNAPTPEQLDPPELRAVWVDAFHDGFKTPEQVDDLIAWARSANLNALFVEVRRRGDAYYLKSLEPRAEDPDLAPGFDALQYLIERAHQGPQRLQVHAWLATLPIWYRRDTPPLAPDHAFNLHGLTADPADTWLMYRDDGEAWAGGIYYLDPGNPAV